MSESIHTPTVNERHVIYPYEGKGYDVTCPCGFSTTTYKRRRDAEAWLKIHVENESARETAIAQGVSFS